MNSRRLAVAVAAVALLCCAFDNWSVRAQEQSSNAKQSAAATAPALPHDSHDGLTIQVDAYTTAARCKEKFGKADPYGVGVLPVDVTLRNDSTNLIRVDINTIQLTVKLSSGHQDLDWMAPEEVAALIVHPAGAGAPTRPRIAGIPIPSGDKKVDKITQILEPLTLNSDTISPQRAVHGFVYFNVNHEMSLADNAKLYVPDVMILPSKKPLIFFEVPLVTPVPR